MCGGLVCGGSSVIAPPCHITAAVSCSFAAAAGSVGLNYYGSLLTESKRVELQKEVGGGSGERQRGLTDSRWCVDIVCRRLCWVGKQGGGATPVEGSRG